MFIVELFEKQQPKALKKIVIMPGGFHPWHPGHSSLYASAIKAFPDADIYVASTNDTSERPFPFEVKRQLAAMAGVPVARFVQVKSPFQPKEITGQYDPESTVLIFVRSDKDREESPRPGVAKKDGSPGYLQPYGDKLDPMSRHGYIAYLPTVEFRAGQTGITSATQIRKAWPGAAPQVKQQIVQDLYPKIAKNPQSLKRAVELLDSALGVNVAESTEHQNSRAIALLRKVRAMYPVAHNDQEALAMYIMDRTDSELDRLDRENDSEEADIDDLEDTDVMVLDRISSLEQQIADIQAAIKSKQIAEEAGGVGVIATKAQARDPRYSMSLTRDVRPGQIQKSLKAFMLDGGWYKGKKR
jgi:hypothetical protein